MLFIRRSSYRHRTDYGLWRPEYLQAVPSVPASSEANKSG
jgi:hypothetical protein